MKYILFSTLILLALHLPAGSIHAKTTCFGDKPELSLRDALREGHNDEADCLIDNGYDVNKPSKYGTSVLETAIIHAPFQLVKKLYDKGARGAEKDRSFLHFLAERLGLYKDHTDIFKIIDFVLINKLDKLEDRPSGTIYVTKDKKSKELDRELIAPTNLGKIIARICQFSYKADSKWSDALDMLDRHAGGKVLLNNSDLALIRTYVFIEASQHKKGNFVSCLKKTQKLFISKEALKN